MPERSPGASGGSGKGHPRKLTASRNQCPTCKEYFNSDAAFDMHRVGVFKGTKGHEENPRRCMTVSEMLESGMEINKDGFWITGPYDRRWG